MGIDRKRLISTNAPLIGFGGTRVFPLGTIALSIMVGNYPQQITKDVTFLVVDCSSAYNAILGRHTLNSWKAVTSTDHLMIMFPTDYGVGELRGNQVAARKCYVAMMEIDDHLQAMSIEEHRTVTEPVKKLEEVLLDDSKLNRTTKIETLANLVVRQALTIFLRNNQDVFAWSHEDMPGIDPSVMVHRLNVSPSFPPIQQKKQVFAPERNQTITKKVRKLQEASFIKEIYYPDWLENIVMVKKASGKWRMCVDFIDQNKACPKDSYPLPQVNVLVDSTA